MRLDLFLKQSRLMKRRSVAREMIDNGRVLVNGHEAKPAKEVRVGDCITVKRASRSIDVIVIGLPEGRNSSPEQVYRVQSETLVPEEQDLWSRDRSLS
ncbi:MAG TPA: RNA-binding S4 domain-containing protein [Nitrospirota bacterium]|nr:RNA-binding S4 domain-containing protein [Nitrospirota bacterium]